MRKKLLDFDVTFLVLYYQDKTVNESLNVTALSPIGLILKHNQSKQLFVSKETASPDFDIFQRHNNYFTSSALGANIVERQ